MSSSTSSRRSDTTDRHPAQYLALAIGVVYTLIGILGFFVTGFDNFVGETNETLLGFEINPLHNIVHLVIGLAGLALWNRLASAGATGGSSPSAMERPSSTACSRSATPT